MKQIEITDSAKEYLDDWRTQHDTERNEPLTYSQVIKRLKNRSWNAAHGGGQPKLEVDERDIEDEHGSTYEHLVRKVENEDASESEDENGGTDENVVPNDGDNDDTSEVAGESDSTDETPT